VCTNDAIVLSQVSYAYRLLVVDYFMKRIQAGSGGTYTLS